MSKKPHWLRVNPSIRAFILGEVERQYHPIGTFEYRDRVEWMTDAWQWSMERWDERPTVDDVLFIAGRIEPSINKNGYRRNRVMIGDHIAPDPSLVPHLVERLWSEIDVVKPVQGRGHPSPSNRDFTADDFYLEFERIHPFGDGNGRTGKILHNWLLGTLEDPVLIHDYFGGGNP